MRYAQIPNLGPVPYTVQPASPDTDTSTGQTVALMNEYIQAGQFHPLVVRVTREALAAVPMDAPAWRRAMAVWDWMHRRVRFVADEEQLASYYGLPESMELLQRPELLAVHRRGDCDDFTMLACAMLQCAGVPYRIVTIAADQNEPDRFSHVYAVAILESGQAVPMDTSHGRYFGWEAPRAFRRVEWPS